jgi:hypothetical protein
MHMQGLGLRGGGGGPAGASVLLWPTGLLDNESTRNLTKIPILGDIPILGELFKSRALRQRRTELVVLVTPALVMASDTAPPVPTGEPGTMPPAKEWGWEGNLKGPAPRGNPMQNNGATK